MSYCWDSPEQMETVLFERRFPRMRQLREGIDWHHREELHDPLDCAMCFLIERDPTEDDFEWPTRLDERPH